VIPAPVFDEVTEVVLPLAFRFCNSSLIVKANIETATTQRTIMAMGFGFDINQQDNCFLQVMKASFICGKQRGELDTSLMLVYNQVVGRVHVYY
jgi:hypothetical protein